MFLDLLDVSVINRLGKAQVQRGTEQLIETRISGAEIKRAGKERDWGIEGLTD